jgi:hypothetical protein
MTLSWLGKASVLVLIFGCLALLVVGSFLWVKVEPVVLFAKKPPPLTKTGISSYKPVICSIALKELLYIDEWIKYHRALGFEQIYLYDNSENNDMQFLNTKYEFFVTVKHYPGRNLQTDAYNDFRVVHQNESMWVAILDCDEFINLYKHKNIRDFIDDRIQQVQQIPNHYLGMISLNWYIFGDNNQTSYSPLPVVQRFTTRQAVVSGYSKSLSYLPLTVYSSTHCSVIGSKIPTDKLVWVDGDGRILRNCCEDFRLNETANIASIHHYHTKSKDEWKLKRERGLADKPFLNQSYNHSNFYTYNVNSTTYDDSAWRFYKLHVLNNTDFIRKRN